MSEKEKLQLEGCNFFVAAVDLDRIVLHICGYPEYPTDNDITSLIEELAVDEELGLVGLNFLENYLIVDITENELIDQKIDKK